MMEFRASPILRASIVKWAEGQPDMPTLSETRRLVELGLTAKATKPKQAPQARATPDDLAQSRAAILLKQSRRG